MCDSNLDGDRVLNILNVIFEGKLICFNNFCYSVHFFDARHIIYNLTVLHETLQNNLNIKRLYFYRLFVYSTTRSHLRDSNVIVVVVVVFVGVTRNETKTSKTTSTTTRT